MMIKEQRLPHLHKFLLLQLRQVPVVGEEVAEVAAAEDFAPATGSMTSLAILLLRPPMSAGCRPPSHSLPA